MERGIMGKVEMGIIKVKDVKEVNGFGDHVSLDAARYAAHVITYDVARHATHADAAVAWHVPVAAIANDAARHATNAVANVDAVVAHDDVATPNDGCSAGSNEQVCSLRCQPMARGANKDRLP